MFQFIFERKKSLYIKYKNPALKCVTKSFTSTVNNLQYFIQKWSAEAGLQKTRRKNML